MTAVTSHDNHYKRTMNIKLFIKISGDDCHISTEHLRLVSIEDDYVSSILCVHIYSPNIPYQGEIGSIHPSNGGDWNKVSRKIRLQAKIICFLCII